MTEATQAAGVTAERIEEIRERIGQNAICAYAAGDCFAGELLAALDGLTRECTSLAAGQCIVVEGGLTNHETGGQFCAMERRALTAEAQANEARRDQELEAVTMLQQEWGAAYDLKVAHAARAARYYGGQELVDWLNSTGLGNEPKLVRAFAKIGEALSTQAKEEE